MNNQVAQTKETTASAQHLGDLFKEARTFGRATIFSHEDDTYHAKITFQTVAGTELRAESSYREPTPEAAVTAAITKAKIIAAQFK